MSAAPKHGKPARTGCSVITSGRQTGTSGGYLQAAGRAVHDQRVVGDRRRAAVHDEAAALGRPHVPEAYDVLDRPQQVDLPRPDRRRAAIVGVRVRSMRSITPASSIRRNMSSSDEARAADSQTSAGHAEEDGRVGLDHGPVEHPRLARAHPADRPGSTPRWSSHTIASVAVLPDPTTTYWLGRVLEPRRSLTGTTRAPSTAKGGGTSAGMVGAR